MMLNSKSIGNKIASARKKLNLSQAELAQQVSISPQAVGKWERGESMPDIGMLNRLAEILKTDLNYFSDSFPISETLTAVQELTNTSTATAQTTTSGKKHDWSWDMSQGNWADADFSGLKNLKEQFSSSNMKNCKFINSDLSELILAKNNIEQCDFTSSNIRNSKIQSSNLLNNKFDKCSFIDADFFKCNIEKCDLTDANFSGTKIIESNLESIDMNGAIWRFTKFFKANISNISFTGTIENCHFEHCSFYSVKFENATITNTFFKYNKRLKKVQFINCKVDSITYAFLKNNQANLDDVNIID